MRIEVSTYPMARWMFGLLRHVRRYMGMDLPPPVRGQGDDGYLAAADASTTGDDAKTTVVNS